MREYESTLIIQPEISDEGVGTLQERLDGTLEGFGAIRLIYDDLGKRRLAYEIQNFQKGRYVMLQFLDSGQLIPRLERVLRLDDSVLRFLTVLVAEDVPDVEARKAEAAEEVRIREQKAAERAAREAEEAAARAEREAEAAVAAEAAAVVAAEAAAKAAAEAAAEAAANPAEDEATSEDEAGEGDDSDESVAEATSEEPEAEGDDSAEKES